MLHCPCCNGHLLGHVFRTWVTYSILGYSLQAMVLICPYCSAWTELSADGALIEYPGLTLNELRMPLVCRRMRRGYHTQVSGPLYNGRES